MTLTSLGWDDFFANHFQPFAADGFLPARVSLQHKHAFDVLCAGGELAAMCTGRLLHDALSGLSSAPGQKTELPAVGDWVALRPRLNESPPRPGQRPIADIHAVLPRRTKFSRRAAGAEDVEQIVAANIDTVFLVTALDSNFDLRRIERYLAVGRESGAQPVVVLNKSDLHPAPDAARAEVESVAASAPVVAVSAACGDGFGGLDPWLGPGRTVAFLGSSGVGKSTLINRLLGAEHQLTGAVSDAVNKGRHTTTHRELIVAPSGALVIDTPGMRELQLWNVEASTIDSTFADIAALATRCHFRDCAHGAEPGCAVQASLEDGSLEPNRWQNYQKLQREQAYAARKADARLARETKAHWKKLNQAQRARYRMEERG